MNVKDLMNNIDKDYKKNKTKEVMKILDDDYQKNKEFFKRLYAEQITKNLKPATEENK